MKFKLSKAERMKAPKKCRNNKLYGRLVALSVLALSPVLFIYGVVVQGIPDTVSDMKTAILRAFKMAFFPWEDL